MQTHQLPEEDVMVGYVTPSRTTEATRIPCPPAPATTPEPEGVPCPRSRVDGMIVIARAEALFTSDASAHCQLTRAQVTEAIRRAVRRYGGCRGCAAEVAAAYGERPETAAPRMRWARTVVESVFGGTDPQRVAQHTSHALAS